MRSCTLLVAALLALATPALAETGTEVAADAAIVADSAEVDGDVDLAAAADPAAAPSTDPASDAAVADAAPINAGDGAIDPAAALVAPADPNTMPLAGAPAPDAGGLEIDFDAVDPATATSESVAMPASPTAQSASSAAQSAAARSRERAAAITLGPEAVDEHGHRGRIHTVSRGDTLWDISTAYLGTPWVWPSVWGDNGAIENPHLITPGDRIWVTAGEMRKITHEQAEEMIRADNDAVPPAPEVADEESIPAALDETVVESEPAAMEDAPLVVSEPLPVAEPLAAAPSLGRGRSLEVVEREAMGFVTGRALEASTSVVDSPAPRMWLVEGDLVYLGLGEGGAEVGDQFTVFRDAEPVRDVDGGRLLGYHVDILGWLTVREIRGDSAIAEIEMSYSEISRGDRVIPRTPVTPIISLRSSPDGIDGRIVFMPQSRTTMGSSDHVYLNRGASHGFEVGSEIEVFTPGRRSKDRVTGDKVMTPDRVDAQLVIVEVKPDTSVAYVVHARRELEIGDTIRASAQALASR